MNTYSNHYAATPSLDEMLRLMKEVDDFVLTKKLYVESKFTDCGVYKLNGTRVIVGPTLDTFDSNTARGIALGFEVLPLIDNDVAYRMRMLEQYGMPKWVAFQTQVAFKMEWR